MLRFELFREVVAMAVETLRTNKMRSALTTAGVVIGVTAIVGMTSLVRGFDESLTEMIDTIGPKTLFVAKFSGVSFMSGKSFTDLIRRPNLTVEDARAVRRLPEIGQVDLMLGGGVTPRMESVRYENERTKLMPVVGASEYFAELSRVDLAAGRMFTSAELNHRRPVAVLGRAPAEALFPNVDPIGKSIRIGDGRYTVIGVFGRRPSPGGFDVGQDEFVLIPYTHYQRRYGLGERMIHGAVHVDVTLVVEPHEDVSQEAAMRALTSLLRARHGLRLHEENDFDIVSQQAAGKLFEQVTSATFLALVVLSSIALLVGGIGVMAIMTISVTERTREIGLRKALGARRREILWQFLLEAAALTSLGGALGVLLGSAVGATVHFTTGFPVSLPWWSFALGFGFSAGVGLAFGTFPALRAARLDPIEALRHE